MRIRFVRDINKYNPEKKFGTELVFFWLGFIISKTKDHPITIETYNVKTDRVEHALGYKQEFNVFGRFKGEKVKYKITKNVPKSVWES